MPPKHIPACLSCPIPKDQDWGLHWGWDREEEKENGGGGAGKSDNRANIYTALAALSATLYHKPHSDPVRLSCHGPHFIEDTKAQKG